jgi:predicted Rossmann fold nucleotide-binding protein DprA/Smf involved in DNA uptake
MTPRRLSAAGVGAQQIDLDLDLSATEFGADAARLWKVLAPAPSSVEHLARAAALPVARALAALTRLEVAGRVDQTPGLNFARAQGGWDHRLPTILEKRPEPGSPR